MMMADDSSNLLSFNELSAGDDDFDGLSIDLDSLWGILGESPDPEQNRPDDSSLNNVVQGLPWFEGVPSLEAGLPGSITFSDNSEASDYRMGGSDGSSESAGNSVIFESSKLEPSAQVGSLVHSCSGHLVDWMPSVPCDGSLCVDRFGVSQNASSYSQNDSKETQFEIEIPDCSAFFSFLAGDANHVSDDRETDNLSQLAGETELQFRSWKDSSHNQFMEKPDVNYGMFFDASENRLKTLGAPKIEEMDVDMSLHSSSDAQSSFCEIPDISCKTGNQYSAMQHYMSTNNSFYSNPSRQYLPESFDIQSVSTTNDELMVHIKNDGGELLTQDQCLNTGMTLAAQVERAGGADLEGSVIHSYGVRGFNANSEGGNYISPMSGDSSDKTIHRIAVDKAARQPLPRTLSNMSSKPQFAHRKDERNDKPVISQGTSCQSLKVVADAVNRKSFHVADGMSTDKGLRQSLSGILTSISSKNHVVQAKDEKEDVVLAFERARHSFEIIDETTCRTPTLVADNHSLVQDSKESYVQPSTSFRKQLGFIKEERESKLTQINCRSSDILEVNNQASQSNALIHRSHVDDNPHVCDLEDMSEPPGLNQSPVNGKSFLTSQRSTFSDPLSNMGVRGMRRKTNDERVIFRVALQDLSQPKSEATPPDGFLAVPLLRHQRIALSWMVQKETASLHCSGGILADDQGLGKTISTIALILKERSPSSRLYTTNAKQKETQRLNLDDDDGVSEVVGSEQVAEFCQVNGSTVKRRNTSLQAKGRPAAGTLVVCPTSVLRQWSDELHNKVNSNANLSVLVYHGSNRTKDPCELAKYDVVITTYAIVSMEVPKQPLVDEDDDEIGKHGHVPPMALSSSKKRKYPPSYDKRSLKGKNATDNDFLESIARPLARVGWFRVVLDEAQSIKNHRTQVARACWGLRAKRRWCLSGTPIQNAVDDLYSYFRFLRYDPYAVYKSFCSTIKVPIHRNPRNGYRKLQAVLKTIMLRRTKGTLLDGEPIINLPPKTVELKKVEFTKEERDFYSRLEADSRAQFAEYAAAGTVKQNYVNILLMLLRLRQACDHPLLVRGYNSNSVWRSSIEMAKKLPREKQVFLLDCLETSLAICGICNDPPEDAVVTSCGHVFCNQCICEHLTGDENQCLATNCKAQVSKSSVYLRATLRSALSDQPGQGSIPDCSGSEESEPPETLESCFLGCSFYSSKIKAAVDVLQSLSKPRDYTSGTNSSTPVDEVAGSGNSCDTISEEFYRDMHDNKTSDLNTGSNNLVTIVGEKAIVFSQWTGMLDLLEGCLKNSSIRYRRLDGTMSVVARDKAVKDFNTLPEVSVIIMSLKAASLGLNMVAACHVLLLDLWWNPTTEDQAIDRAHRIGQTRPVTVLRLTVKDTVEDRILALQRKKREMVASAFGEDETGSRQTRLTEEDLKYLFMV